MKVVNHNPIPLGMKGHLTSLVQGDFLQIYNNNPCPLLLVTTVGGPCALLLVTTVAMKLHCTALVQRGLLKVVNHNPFPLGMKGHWMSLVQGDFLQVDNYNPCTTSWSPLLEGIFCRFTITTLVLLWVTTKDVKRKS